MEGAWSGAPSPSASPTLPGAATRGRRALCFALWPGSGPRPAKRMLWGSSRPGRRAEEFLAEDLHQGGSRVSLTKGSGGGRHAELPQTEHGGTRWVSAVARARQVPRRRFHVKLGGRKARVRARGLSAPRGARAPAGPHLVPARAPQPLCRRASPGRPAAAARAGDSNGRCAAGRDARGRGDLAGRCAQTRGPGRAALAGLRLRN